MPNHNPDARLDAGYIGIVPVHRHCNTMLIMPSDTPSVSIIIPAYNASAHIVETLESVFAQHYEPMEIIVVDDGSSDGTAELVAKAYPSVRVIRKQNGGAASARNAGIRIATGDYIAFLDADDFWLPGKLHAQYRYFQAHPEVRLLCTDFAVWRANEHGFFAPPSTLAIDDSICDDEIDVTRSGWLYHKLLMDCTVWTSTVMMHRSLVEEVGEFDESLRLGQDYDYWLRASRTTPIGTLQRPFAFYRQHPESATKRGASVNYGAIILSNALQKWGTSSPNGESIPRQQVLKRIADIHFSNGYHHYQRGTHYLALRELWHSLLMKPFRVKTWTYLVLASIGAAVSQRGSN